MTEARKRPWSNRVENNAQLWDTVLIHEKKYVHIRPASLFCLLSSLIKCKVGREPLWKLGSSFGRGKRLHLMCLPECVCVGCFFTSRAWLHTHLSLSTCHCYFRLVALAWDQSLPLRTSYQWFHLLVSCFLQWRASFCASSTISQDFTVASANSHSLCAPFESPFNRTTACIEEIRVCLNSLLHHLPALPFYYLQVSSVQVYVTLLCPGSWKSPYTLEFDE